MSGFTTGLSELATRLGALLLIYLSSFGTGGETLPVFATSCTPLHQNTDEEVIWFFSREAYSAAVVMSR